MSEYDDSSVENTENTGDDTSLAATGNDGGEDSGFNQAWAPLFEALPESLRNLEQVRTPLKEWDKNYQSLQEKYKPFESVPENYRNPEALNAAVNILENLNNNPHLVLSRLAEQLGVTFAEAKEIVDEVKEQEPELEFSDDDDPRLKALNDQIRRQEERFNSFFEQQTQAEQERLVEQQAKVEGSKIDQQVKALIDAGHFGTDPADQQVGIRGLMTRAKIHLDAGSRDPIGAAFAEQQAEYAVIAKRFQQQNRTPQNLLFMPTGGQAPSTAPVAPDLDTQEGRFAYAKQIRDMVNGG